MTTQPAPQPVTVRTLILGGGATAEIRLDESDSGRVQFAEKWENALGGQGPGSGPGWARCAEPGCRGEAIPSGRCFAHVDEPTRTGYVNGLRNSGGSFSLKGVRVDQDLWEEVVRHTFDGQNVQLPMDCWFATFTFNLRLTSRTFREFVSFYGAQFLDGIEVRDCAFEKGAGIRFASFGNTAGAFYRCKFAGPAVADFCESEQFVAFTECEFNDGLRAMGVHSSIRLDRSEVNSTCELSNTIGAYVDLRGTRFNGELSMVDVETVTLHANDIDATNTHEVGPIVVARNAFLRGARFAKQVRFQLDAATADFAGASFPEGGRMEVTRAVVALDRVSARARLTVVGKDEASVSSIHDADCSTLTFASVDLRGCHFGGALELRDVTLDTTAELRKSPPWRARRRCIADEYAWRSHRGGRRSKAWITLVPVADPDEPHVPDTTTLTAGQIAGLYRSLRVSLEAHSNEPGAADFYYGEMEMRRLDKDGSRAERAIVWAYWAGAGYGLRALRSLIWFAIIIAAGTWVMQHVGIVAGKSRPGYVAGAVATLQSAIPGLKVKAALTTTGEVASIAVAVLGPVLVGLIALALRNRVKR